jgi:RNA polymerase sigma-70 factor (ECF subfamily)
MMSTALAPAALPRIATSRVKPRTADHSTGRTTDPDPDPDADVLALVDLGDADSALRRLMARHGAAVYRYCREALRDGAVVDDVHQQIFIAAYRDLPRFRRQSRVRLWLFAIARHRVLDAVKHRRNARRWVEDIAFPDPPDSGPSPADSIDAARLRQALAASLDELPADTRTAVLLRYQQGFTYAEMAKICGAQAGTLYARVTRALPLLRKRIEARLR